VKPNHFSNIGMQNPPADEKPEGGGEVFKVIRGVSLTDRGMSLTELKSEGLKTPTA
jgi:hypothetical protein